MVIVYIWNYRGLNTAMGHASMRIVGSEYISWWPQGDPNRDYKIPGTIGTKAPLYSAPHIHGQTYQDDAWGERIRVDGVWKSKKHDHKVMLEGLDEKKILAWWSRFNTVDRSWKTFGQNCATTVGRALMMGGGDDYSAGFQGWWDSWNMIWQPNDVHRYAQQIELGLKKQAGMHAAINLVRRFSKSPLKMTSVTRSMDEAGLARAIYAEVGANTLQVTKVFQVLDSRHNSDADDVAELYVKLLQANKGAQLAAVSRDRTLKNLLIKVLDEGWTSAGEKQCIAYLKSLN